MTDTAPSDGGAALTDRVSALESLFAEGRASALDHALAAIERDPHQFSERPCETCRFITGACGRKFGCDAKRALLAELRKEK